MLTPGDPEMDIEALLSSLGVNRGSPAAPPPAVDDAPADPMFGMLESLASQCVTPWLPLRSLR
eukprot:COSAG01_NODE_16076_length_1272_cov_1.993180_3_plen_63_part_00